MIAVSGIERRGWRYAALGTALAVGLSLVPIASIHAQSYDPLAEGFSVHVQAGFAWATQHGVEPVVDGTTFARRSFPNYSLRVSRLLAGRVSGYMEAALAQRGGEIRQPGLTPVRLRSRWYDAGLGVNLAARCIHQLCPSLDAGAVLGFHRETVASDVRTGQLVGALEAQPTETAAVFGVRVASARFRGIAAVIRHHEGLTDWPDDGSKGRNRALTFMLSLPLGR